MTVFGPDVSSYQPNWRPSQRDAFCIVKATEGTTYRNPSHADQVKRARDAGLVCGHYHYLHAGNPEKQAAFFAATPGIRDFDVLCADWEATPHISTAEKDRFVRAVQKLWPRCRMLIYASTYYPPFAANPGYLADGLWIADYRGPEPKMAWLFWQYSDKPIDQNKARFPSVEALKAWATFTQTGPPITPDGTPVPAPQPVPTNIEGSPLMAAGAPIVSNLSTPQPLQYNIDGYVLTNDKGSISLVAGSSPGIDVMAALTVEGLKAGEWVDFWWTKEAVKTGTANKQNGNDGHVTVGFIDGAPHVGCQVLFKHLLAAAPAGWNNLLRLRFHTNSHTAVIAYKQFRGWKL